MVMPLYHQLLWPHLNSPFRAFKYPPEFPPDKLYTLHWREKIQCGSRAKWYGGELESQISIICVVLWCCVVLGCVVQCSLLLITQAPP